MINTKSSSSASSSKSSTSSSKSSTSSSKSSIVSSKPKNSALDNYQKINSNFVYKEFDLRKKVPDDLQKEIKGIKDSGVTVVLIDSGGSRRTRQFLSPGSDPYLVRKDLDSLLDSRDTQKKVIKVPGEKKNPVQSSSVGTSSFR